MEQVVKEDLITLIETFSKRMFRAKDHDSQDEEFLDKCLTLFSKDYTCSIIKNDNGELSAHYPNKMIILEKDKLETNSSSCERKTDEYDLTKLREHIVKAKNARCRTRFPLPVMLFEGKSICRSATLSGGPEIYGRSGLDYLFSGNENMSEKTSTEVDGDVKVNVSKRYSNLESKDSKNKVTDDLLKEEDKYSENSSYNVTEVREIIDQIKSPSKEAESADVEDKPSSNDLINKDEFYDEVTAPQNKTDWQLFTKVRSQDIRLLKFLNVQYIVDLMVEKKKVKFGINVTSSEKVDKENRYSDFTIVSLPYPGCEFFRVFRDQNYCADNLVFEWNQSFVNADLIIPHDNISSHVRVDWTSYKKWDLIVLTKNYLKLILRYIAEGKSGMLIHCISGWDRTPLYISLVRLSLWADGKIHTSLGPYEILYLIIAYDWYFFGHNLVDRLEKGEEIFFFLFFVLKHFMSDQFSMQYINSRSTSNLSRNESDVNIDGVLLESSFEAGSNTSLNSVDSTTSTRSSLDGAPIHFSVSSNNPPAENVSISFRPSSLSCRPQSQNLSPNQLTSSEAHHCDQKQASGDNRLDSSTDTIVPDGSMTLPVPVPSSTNEQTVDTTCYGSWQVISGTGSVSGSTLLSVGSSGTNSGYGEGSDHSIDSSKQLSIRMRRPSTPRTRKDRLNSVRDLFYSLYSSTIGFRGHVDASSYSKIFEQMAEKMGIKSSKPVPV